MTSTGNLLDEAKHLFDFLVAVQRVRETPIRKTEAYEAVYWFSKFPEHESLKGSYLCTTPETDEPLITVDRTLHSDPPDLTSEVRPWLCGDIYDSSACLSLNHTIPATSAPELTTRMLPNGPSPNLYLEDEPEIGVKCQDYINRWQAWASADQRDQPVRDLYGDLFSAYQTATSQSDTFELVLGVGCLSWQPADHEPVCRHILTFPAAITFDEHTGRLSVTREAALISTRVELDMLDPKLLPIQMNDLQVGASQYNGHPLNSELVGEQLRQFAHQLDAQGSYSPDITAPSPGPNLRLAFAPALILRRRSQRGLIDMYEKIRNQLDELGTVPPGLVSLIDPDYLPESTTDDTPGGLVHIDDEIFLPMPVNDRQMRVIQAVDQRSQVVVQGPPGTGKTHTAAALLSHLLAQGKRVLVTAQTDRALQEIRGKLPEAIRPLSVAVIGSSQTDMADVRVAVSTISNRADEHDPEQALKSIDKYLNRIDDLRQQRALAYTQLRESRQAETSEFIVGPYSGTLARITEALKRDSATFDWLQPLTGTTISNTPPLSNADALEWLNLETDPMLQAEDDSGTQSLLPLSSLPYPEEVALWIDTEANAVTQAQSFSAWQEHAMFTSIATLKNEDRVILQGRILEIATMIGDLASRCEGWVAEAVRDMCSGRRQIWQSRAQQLGDLITQCSPHVTALGPLTQVWVASPDLPTWAAMARTLQAFFIQGGTLKIQPDGMPKIGALTSRVIKDSQPFFTSVKVNGLPATSRDQIAAFLSFAEGSAILDALDRIWPVSVSIPLEDTLAERLQWHIDELHQFSRVLELGNQIAELEAWMGTMGLAAPDWTNVEHVRSYAVFVDAVSSVDALTEAQIPLNLLTTILKPQTLFGNSSPLTEALCTAVTTRDCSAYRLAYQQLATLHEQRARVAHRAQLAESLSSQAPLLVEAVKADLTNSLWRERLDCLEEAWQWTATYQWLSDRKQVDVNALQREIDSTEKKIRKEIEKLAATRAWLHALSPARMSGIARAFLQQYASLVKRLGKGTGKYANKRRQEIRESLDRCRPTVPVWIMPIYRLAEQLRIECNMFDVVLIDEASQAGLEAAFLQYLAPKIIVIGDDKQVSPAAVGIDQEQIRDLANRYLANNPFKASWLDPTRSYFDEAVMRFGGKITLIEHRRCVPDIIGFSNRIAYEPDGIRLLPVRQQTADALPPIRTVHVPDGFEKGQGPTNPAEADAIVEQVIRCAADPAYAGKTFGVISLLGKAQAKLIQGKLFEALDSEEWVKRDLRCGDAADFQGSERDIVFLSMVKAVSPGTTIHAITSSTYIQRYNVAASRAKDQMWLFHSMLLSDLGNPEDMRFALLDYMTNVQSRQQNADPRVRKDLVPDDVRVEPFDSLFEQRVFNHIHGRGYSVIAQYPAEGYNIDLVVVGAHGNLAIECDGDTWHGPEQYAKDLARQRDLERCGWTFFRVRESAYYLDPDDALSELWPQLEALNKAVNH